MTQNRKPLKVCGSCDPVDDIYFANDANEIIQYDRESRIRWVYNTRTHRPVRGEIAAS